MIIRTPADLGATIRAWRLALGLGQAEPAARVGVQRQWIIKIESGKSTATERWQLNCYQTISPADRAAGLGSKGFCWRVAGVRISL
jgi:DNA-binding XRE family transcriptional regulator